MHHLIEVTNTGEMLRTARKCNGKPLVVGVRGFQRAIVKFDLVSVCEVFGYLLASATGTRVPRMQGFWTRDALDTDTVKSKPGRVGILVEFHEDWMPVRRCQVARFDPAMFAQASALCVFDRHEWGEFGVSRGQVYFVDLERLFPPLRPEELFSASGQQRMELLSEWEQLFLDVTSNSLEKVLLDAAGHQLESEVRQAIQRLCGLEHDWYAEVLRIGGYPLASLLSAFVASVCGQKLNLVARELGLPARKVQSWRDAVWIQ